VTSEPAEVEYEKPPRPPASERFRAIRTTVIGLVIMWVVVVVAWAADRGFDVIAADRERERAETARARLANVAELSSVFNAVNEAIEPSVVNIVIERRTPNRPNPFGIPTPDANTGSGVVVEVEPATGIGGREAGFVLTNAHVVAGAGRVRVTLPNGRTVDGRLLGADPQSDLAVLQIVADGLVPAPWGDSDLLKKGDWVLAFGSPFGFVGSMTSGIVSALNRTQTDGIITPLGQEALQSFIQVDAAINPGNSGGPLVNVAGEVVGINTAIFTRTGDFSGIGFAIPSNQARRVYEDIRDRGRVVRGWLGVRLVSTASAPEVAARLGFDPDEDAGVLLTRVFRDTPADEAGLRQGDIITRIDGQPVDDTLGVRNKAAFARPGEALSLEVFRDGASSEVELVVGEQPPGLLDLDLPEQGDASRLGFTLEDPPEGTGNALVADVRRGSPAWNAGIRRGDRIFAIDGNPVRNAATAAVLLARSTPLLGVELRIESGRRVYTVTVREE
jgi:serine protease Do